MLDLIKTKKFALIFSHKGPDGDSVGSSVSLSLYLSKIGISNKIIFPDPYPHFLSWMTGLENSLVASEKLEEVTELFQQSDLIFCLDFNHRSRVGHDLKNLISNVDDKHVVVFDHHTKPENFGDVEIINQNGNRDNTNLIPKIKKEKIIKNVSNKFKKKLIELEKLYLKK